MSLPPSCLLFFSLPFSFFTAFLPSPSFLIFIYKIFNRVMEDIHSGETIATTTETVPPTTTTLPSPLQTIRIHHIHHYFRFRIHPPSDKTNETNEMKEKDEGQEKDRCQAYLEKLYPLLVGAVDISMYEDECRSLLGVSYNTLSSIMTHHDIIKEILVRIVHNGQACGAGDASAPSDDVQRAVRQVAVSFHVRDCPSPEHARECVSIFSPLSLPLSSPLLSLPHHSHQKYTEI